MKHVNGKKLLFFLFITFSLASCKDPELQMTPLGKKLPAPALKGASPFQQDVYLQKYARIQGSCDTRVSTVFISFNKNLWHQAPATPDLTDTALPAGQLNDTDCSDGSFDIYLTKNDLLHIWGINSGSDDVNAIYIKGLSVIGDTETLTLLDMKSPGNGGSTIATNINLDKDWPRGYAGTNQCGSFHVYLSNSNGYRAVHSSAVTFSIKQSASGSTSGTNIVAHSNWTDCVNNTNAKSVFEVPAGQDYAEVVYRFPTSPIDGVLSFSLANPSALTANPVPVSVTLRDSESSSTQRWLSLEQTNTQIYKNVCYPFKLRSQMYNNSPAYDQFGGTIKLTTSDARLRFFTSETCATPTTEYTFAAYDPALNGYIKFVPTGVDTETFVSLQVSTTGAAGNTYSYDSQPIEFRVDLSDKSLVTKLDFWGPRDIVNGDCNRYQIVPMNANGAALPLAANLAVSLGASYPNLGQFFSDESCQTAVSSIVMNKGQMGAFVYFSPAAVTPGTYNFNISAPGLTSATPLMKIQSLARQFKITPLELTAGDCKAISVGLIDGAGIYKTAPSLISTTVQVYLSPGGNAALYADASCSTTIAGYTAPLTIPQGASFGTVYIKTAGLSGVIFNIMVSSITGLYGSDWGGTFQ